MQEEKVKKSAEQIRVKKQDVKYDTRDYVVKYIVDQYNNEDFYIPLEYQRRFIWTDKNKCDFIESILIGLPIPFMFFADVEDGRTEIVDGAQRVQTLVQFVQNDLQLHDLGILTESNDFFFSDLDLPVQRRFLNSLIRVVYLEQGTTTKVRQEIFKRINMNGMSLEPQEARRGSYEGKFKDFLEKCAADELFNKLAPRTVKREDRFEGFELAARFFAYFDGYHTDFEDYDGRVAQYIDAYVERKNKEWSNNAKEVRIYKTRFNNMLSYTEQILGDRGFRKTLQSRSTPRARFEALSIGIALAQEINPDLPQKDVSGWIDGDEFIKITKSDAANNKKNLLKRINYVKDQLLNG